MGLRVVAIGMSHFNRLNCPPFMSETRYGRNEESLMHEARR